MEQALLEKARKKAQQEKPQEGQMGEEKESKE